MIRYVDADPVKGVIVRGPKAIGAGGPVRLADSAAQLANARKALRSTKEAS